MPRKIIISLVLLYLFLVVFYFRDWLLNHNVLPSFLANSIEYDPWSGVPQLELALRMNSDPQYVNLYKACFLKSLRLFWPEDRLRLTVVLDDESKEDHVTGKLLSKTWPKPTVVYLQPGEASVYQGNQRRRMYLSYFYPEQYVTAEYVGFVDTDTMFTTVVTPELLFASGRPTIQARIGEPFWQQHWECWSDVTEYFLGDREALQCMSYFPVVMKVQHIIELRTFVEKRFQKPFLDVFRSSLKFENSYFKGTKYNDCMCQFSIMCNYVWYYHREEYDFHLQMVPDDTWSGEKQRKSQQTVDYIKGIDLKYKVPKPRMSIHARHYIENGEYISDTYIDVSKEPYSSQLERKVREGFCFAIGFDRCPRQCYSIDRHDLHITLYSFEMFDWIWDSRCLSEQKNHYKNVQTLIRYSEKHGKPMFGIHNFDQICTDVFPSDL